MRHCCATNSNAIDLCEALAAESVLRTCGNARTRSYVACLPSESRAVSGLAFLRVFCCRHSRRTSRRIPCVTSVCIHLRRADLPSSRMVEWRTISRRRPCSSFGWPAGLLGRPRLTVDLDAMFLASTKDAPKILDLAEVVGIEPRVENITEFVKKSRVLLLRHKKSGINIDISLGILPFEEEVVERSVRHDAGAVTVRLPTPEDLIILKAVAHRPKDLQDIREVVANNPNLDQRRIERWVKDFAETLEMPELWGQIEKILNQNFKL